MKENIDIWFLVNDTLNLHMSHVVLFAAFVGFYILLRAVDRFAANYNTFPGQFDG